MLRVILLDRSWTGESTRSHSVSVLQYPIFSHGMHSHEYDVRGILASMTSTERVRYLTRAIRGLVHLGS